MAAQNILQLKLNPSRSPVSSGDLLVSVQNKGLELALAILSRHKQSGSKSRQRTLQRILRVRQKVAVERPAEGEEVQGLAALLLSRGADRATGLEDATLRAALRQEHPTH